MSDQSGVVPPPAAPRPSDATGDTIQVGDITNAVGVAIGAGAQVVVAKTASAAEQARELEQLEHERLDEAVRRLLESLGRRLTPAALAGSARLLLLQPYELADAGHFRGRDAARTALLDELRESRFVVLSGVAGSGKSSLLCAGVVPALIAGGHLPIELHAGSAPPPQALKQVLLPNLGQTPALRDMPLTGFLRQVASRLAPGGEVVVIVDQLEQFFEQASDAARHAFVEEVARCAGDLEPVSRWIFCVRSSHLPRMLEFSPQVPQPLAHHVTLRGMDDEEAAAAFDELIRLRGGNVAEPARAALLADLADDTGDGRVEPWKLQLVGHALVHRSPPGAEGLSLEAYQRAGGVERCMQAHLEQVVEQNLGPADQEVAWEALSALAEQRRNRADEAELLARLDNYGVDGAQALRMLGLLENSFLIRFEGGIYQLGSISFLARIREWAITQRTAIQARAEVKRQLDRIRGSALRGLFGGAIGLSLSFLLISWAGMRDLAVLPYMTMGRAMAGGLVGLLLILLVDMAQASYTGKRRALRWVIGGLAGGISFSLALLFHYLVRHPGGFSPHSLQLVGLEGALWGAVVGLGAVWTLAATRAPWRPIVVTAAAGGVALWAGDLLGQAFCRPQLGSCLPAAPWRLLLGGMLLPICVLMAVVLGRSRPPESPARHHWTARVSRGGLPSSRTQR